MSAFTYVGAVLLLGIAPLIFLFVYCQMNIICPHCGKPVMVHPERTFLTGYTPFMPRECPHCGGAHF